MANQKKLTEYLSSQTQLKSHAQAMRTALIDVTFGKKSHHFREKLVTFESNKENEPAVQEEQQLLQTTVAQELAWLKPVLAKALDSEATIDKGNQFARGDVIVDGKPLFEQVPATQLLQLEKRLNELHGLVMAIPTLDPTKSFVPAPERGDGIYRARDVRKTRTQKVVTHVVVVPPTDKHPAQVKDDTIDTPIGVVTEREWSGLLAPSEKSDMLTRVETLKAAVKQARARANDTYVEEVKIGDTLLDYVFANKRV